MNDLERYMTQAISARDLIAGYYAYAEGQINGDDLLSKTKEWLTAYYQQEVVAPCEICDGEGFVTRPIGDTFREVVCRRCDGKRVITADIADRTCAKCHEYDVTDMENMGDGTWLCYDACCRREYNEDRAQRVLDHRNEYKAEVMRGAA